ncbi:MAG: hypothetical protein MZV63_40390 [Marinilabiliales bacterium]|nr:hypothetical protein [Marinilabiliales bacterium]
MSWGAWTLLVINTSISYMVRTAHIVRFFPGWDWKYKWLIDLEDFLQ